MPSEYPANWWDIAYCKKADAKFKCERCGHPEDEEADDMLTVIILDDNLVYYKPGNLAVLCESCRLYIKSISLETLINQLEMFDNFELRWLQPHLECLGVRTPDIRIKEEICQ